MRYFIYLAYDGTSYHGWQFQPNAISVQEALQNVLSTLMGENLSVVGAGRTDTGVHARMMVAHFETGNTVDTDKLTFKMNCMLPSDISVYRIVPVKADAHARFSATARTYHYYISMQKNPFSSRFSTRIYYTLDFEKMNEAAALLMTYTDFGSFCKAHSDNKTNICHVTQAHWVHQGPEQYYFEITADRFLRNMVRAIVGTLMDVGHGRMTLGQFKEVVQRGDRCVAGDSVPAQGLFLENIEYPEDIFI